MESDDPPAFSAPSEALPLGDFDLVRNVDPSPSASKLAGSDSDDDSSGSVGVGAVRVVLDDSPEMLRLRKPGLDGVVTTTSSDGGSGTIDLLVGVECGLKVEGIDPNSGRADALVFGVEDGERVVLILLAKEYDSISGRLGAFIYDPCGCATKCQASTIFVGIRPRN